jgi:hypothetical protein
MEWDGIYCSYDAHSENRAPRIYGTYRTDYNDGDGNWKSARYYCDGFVPKEKLPLEYQLMNPNVRGICLEYQE